MKQALIAALLLCSVARAAPDIEVRKRVDNALPTPGQPVEFTIEVRNVGADPASDVHVRDLLPPGLEIPIGMAAFPGSGTYDPVSGDWAVGDLAAGVSSTLLIPAVVSAPNPPICIVNAAQAAHANDANPANDRAMAAVRQPGVDRCVDLTAEFITILAGPLGCGTEGPLTVHIDVINQGPDVARNVVVELKQSPQIAPNLRFTSAACAGATCTLPQLGSGETKRLVALSDDFSNPSPRPARLSIGVRSDDADFAPHDNIVVRDGTFPAFTECAPIDIGDVGGNPAYCFVATAAYGSALDPHVVTLRQFRDRHLRRTALGRAFIRFYYRHSPPLAIVIAEHEPLRIAARWLLTPLVLTIVYPWTSLSIATLMVALLLGWRLWRRRAHWPRAGIFD